MTFLRAVPVLCTALVATAFAASVRADDWNRKTVITFSQPVETPGIPYEGLAVLPPGTYVFKDLRLASRTAISFRSSIRMRPWSMPRSWPSRIIESGPPTKPC